MSFPDRRLHRPLIAAALAVAALVPLSQAQAGVVVSVSGPSAKLYPVGKKLADTDKVVLKSGDTVTVLDQRGTRVLKGAGTFSLADKPAADRSSTFALLTRQRSAQRVRTGAVRGDDAGPVTRPNLWYVDVRQAGPMCIANPAEVRLWRPATTGEALYVIGADGARASSKAAFSDGEMLTVWDLSQAPVTDGARYVVAGQDGAPHEITFRLLDSVPAAPEDLALKLIEKGCTAQLDVLSAAMNTADG
ncbi:hypothetical protein GCM10011515_02730 [Tsuneonella deserti]|uniref:Secreted protein n=1 Tax=Tsuneonella deserti TaxID=2035528 RepID=A0ABQ1RY55_9SPHN|nr:hypothetical protein [Tsuneonella deserti]GGD86678.1 hypothetical protein GCM10011515_02730 [Tsuneonella deserti]